MQIKIQLSILYVSVHTINILGLWSLSINAIFPSMKMISTVFLKKWVMLRYLLFTIFYLNCLRQDHTICTYIINEWKLDLFILFLFLFFHLTFLKLIIWLMYSIISFHFLVIYFFHFVQSPIYVSMYLIGTPPRLVQT